VLTQQQQRLLVTKGTEAQVGGTGRCHRCMLTGAAVANTQCGKHVCKRGTVHAMLSSQSSTCATNSVGCLTTLWKKSGQQMHAHAYMPGCRLVCGVHAADGRPCRNMRAAPAVLVSSNLLNNEPCLPCSH
jgi:hypothetical protein